MASPPGSSAVSSTKKTLSPFKLWRSKLPDEFRRKERHQSPHNKKNQTQAQPRPSILAGPNMRHTITSATELTSVRNSDFARCTIGDHELKLLQELEGTADDTDYAATYKEFRRKLMTKNDAIPMANLSRPKRNLAKFKMAANLIKGKKLSFLSKAQLAFSPLNPHNEKDTTSLMKKIRQMKLEAGLLQREEPRRGADREEDEEEDEELQMEQELSAEPIPYDDSMDSQKEREVEKTFKYVVGEHAASPFTSEVLLQSSSSAAAPASAAAPSAPASNQKTSAQKAASRKQAAGKSGGIKMKENTSMRDLRNKGFMKNAQALRKKKIRADQQAAAAENKSKRPGPQSKSNDKSKNKKKKTHSHPYQAHQYSEHHKEKELMLLQKGKLPQKLRQACDKKYNLLMEPQHKRCSEVTWSRLKAKEMAQKEKESITIMGSLQPFSLSQSQSAPQMLSSSLLEQEGGAESLLAEEEDHFHRQRGTPASASASASVPSSATARRRDTDTDTDNLITGDALLYSLEREGLFTVDDLDGLSETSGGGGEEEMLEDGSEAGLFNTLDLLQLDIDESDPVLALVTHEEAARSPDGVLAASMGALLFSPQLREGVATRPASAGLGGVTKSCARRAATCSPQRQDLFSYHKKYSLGVKTTRPKSANTSPHVRSSSDFENTSAIPNYVQKKRLVLNRHHAPEVWIS
jgi:hypothetical protein